MMGDELSGRVAAVRAFNRFYTDVIGILQEGVHRSPYSLTEARLIFELAHRGEATEASGLRRALHIDAGYLSRVLARFHADGLIVRERSDIDARRQVIRLTGQGWAMFETLNEQASVEVRELIEGLTDEDQRRLVNAMDVIYRVLARAPRPDAYVLRPLQPGDLGWVVHRHGVLYAEEYGWDETFEALVARIVADYIDHHDPRRESAWIAEVDGEPVGCVFCMKKADETAQLRILLVEPSARGLGIGGRLVDECIRFAQRAGYTRMALWTNDVLVAARRIYERAGFELVKEEPHHSFGHDLVGQYWSRKL